MRRCRFSSGAWIPSSREAQRRYFAAAASGGTTFMRNTEAFSSGPNGPGTRWLTAGRLLRYAAIACASDLVRLANARHALIDATLRASGRLLVYNAIDISVAEHAPIRKSDAGVNDGPSNQPSPA